MQKQPKGTPKIPTPAMVPSQQLHPPPHTKTKSTAKTALRQKKQREGSEPSLGNQYRTGKKGGGKGIPASVNIPHPLFLTLEHDSPATFDMRYR